LVYRPTQRYFSQSQPDKRSMVMQALEAVKDEKGVPITQSKII
jgi:hypothetical protein